MKWYLAALAGATAASVAGMVLLVTSFDPFRSGTYTKVLFYTAWSLSLWGVLTLVFFGLAGKRNTLALYAALRRGFLLALAPVGLSVLARTGGFRTLSAMLLAGTLALAELAALWRSRRNNKTEDFS